MKYALFIVSFFVSVAANAQVKSIDGLSIVHPVWQQVPPATIKALQVIDTPMMCPAITYHKEYVRRMHSLNYYRETRLQGANPEQSSSFSLFPDMAELDFYNPAFPLLNLNMQLKKGTLTIDVPALKDSTITTIIIGGNVYRKQ